jgi:hypothetical protein
MTETTQESIIDRLLSTAYHEAGHAAAGLYFEIAFRSVTIIPDEDSMGKKVNRQNKGFYDNLNIGKLSVRTEARIYQKITSLYAGFAAQLQFTNEIESCNWAAGNVVDADPGADYYKADDLALKLIDDYNCRIALCNYLKERARALFKGSEGEPTKLWSFVEALAKELKNAP